MNKEIATGLIRHGLTLVGGYFVSKGQLDPSDLQTLIGALTGLFGIFWSVKVKVNAA